MNKMFYITRLLVLLIVNISTDCFQYLVLNIAKRGSRSSQYFMATRLPSGITAVYKPKGWSSFDVVAKIRALLNREHNKMYNERVRMKVGHGGTLDPLAEGVLVLGINDGTKLMNRYLSGTKRYEAIGKFGDETDTLDITGKVIKTVDCSSISLELIETVLPKFRGHILQVPPMFSALHKNGTRLYELARNGVVVDREPRNVVCHQLELIRDESHLPYFKVSVECDGGFYVRSLISDIATSCGSVAHMTELKRTKQYTFTVDDCLHQQDWEYTKLVDHIEFWSEKLKLKESVN